MSCDLIPWRRSGGGMQPGNEAWTPWSEQVGSAKHQEGSMRVLITAAAISMALTGSALAKSNPQMKACAAQWKATPHTGSQTYQQFMTTCLHAGTPTTAPTAPGKPTASASGTLAMSPQPVGNAAVTAAKATVVSGAMPANATAKCKDGTFSMSAHHSGSCSHHGGVAQFLK